jgi:dihydroxy-acid dehydratase
MDPANLKAQFQPQPEEPRLLSFPHLPDDAKYEDGTPILNKYSSTLTRGHDFPGAQAMLYAAGVPNEKMMKTAPQVGIASVWWEGNPCK